MLVFKCLMLAWAGYAYAKDTPVDDSIVPGAYIVRFNNGQHSVESFYQNLSSTGLTATPRQNFQLDIFPGTSFHVDQADEKTPEKIMSFDQVESISPVRLYQRSAVIHHDFRELVDVARTNKRNLILGKDNMSTHVMTGVDRLHKEGLDGKGLRIAIIDTGIDYTLPALGGGFGPGFKVGFGRDLVGDDYNGNNTAVPDNDPMDCNGHGTHVAGIVGASDDPYVLGVAPAATLGMYRVFGCEGQAADDVLINAFIMAHQDGVDLITASLGDSNGWPEQPWTAVVAAIVKAGTPCVLSAGNDGEQGIFFASAAAAGTDVISVGSIQNDYTPIVAHEANYTVNNTETVAFGYTRGNGEFGNISLPIWTDTTNLNITDDGCDGFKADLKGKIALIRRGTCTFQKKADAAISAGASYVMFYNNVAGMVTVSVANPGLKGAAMVDSKTGAKWVSSLAAGDKIVLNFNSTTTLDIQTPGLPDNKDGGSINTFSSWGLTNELDLNPIISGPGGNILSTFPAKKGGYAVLSGTSMSAPLIAGIVALYKQSKKGAVTSPREIISALVSTAQPINFYNGTAASPFLAPVAQQGGGLVDAYGMVHSSTTFSPSTIALNDTTNFLRMVPLVINNTGASNITYELTHEPAANVYAFESGSLGEVAEFPPPVDTKYASAVLNPSSIIIPPFTSQIVNTSITPAVGLAAVQIPLYSGFIRISAQGEGVNNTYRVPYAGVAASLENITVIANNTSLSTTKTQNQILYDNELIDSYNITNNVTFSLNLTWATSIAYIDIVGVNITNSVNVGDLKTVGAAPLFPQRWLPRATTLLTTFNGTLNDGKVVDSGVYKFVARIVKPWGTLEGGQIDTVTSANFFIDTSKTK